MPVHQKKLRVLPNPWLHIDEKGRPAGLVRLEQPTNGTAIHGWVGATVASVDEIEPAKRVKVAGRVFEQKHAIEYRTFNHADQPVTVDNTPYYRKRVWSGDLIAFDQATATACGISARSFVKPETLLEQLKQAAIKQFDAENGEGAFEALADIAAEEAETAAAVAKAVAEGKGEALSNAEFVEKKLEDAGLTLSASPGPEGVPTAEGVTLPGDGALTELEGIAPALTPESNSSRSKNRKGSDQ